MCGIIGIASEDQITNKLIAGLLRQEYRGYDSSGIVVLDNKNTLERTRAVGKVANLEKSIKNNGKIDFADHTV